MLNKAEYPRTLNAVHSLLLKYQHNYNSNRNSQSKGVSNQLMFAQRGKIGEDKGNMKDKEQRPRRNMDHINFNYCKEKVHYSRPVTAQLTWKYTLTIMLDQPFFTLLLIGSVCGTSCVEVWQNMRPGDGGSPHYLVGAPIMRLHKASLIFTNAFWSPPLGGLLEYFSCLILLNTYESSLSLAWVGQSLV